RLKTYLDNNNIYNEIELILPEKMRSIAEAMNDEKLIYHNHTIPLTEHLNKVRNSKVILDFVLPGHTGLSFRFFEAIKYEKKIITTNRAVIHYDFYNPNNIFVLDNNYDKISAFLETPYKKIEKHLFEKYSFTNWIKYIF